jgi:hypothetical protein
MIYRILGKVAPVAAVAAALMLGQSVPAGASLIGDTITITSRANSPVDTWSDMVVVGIGNELDGSVAGPQHVTPTMGQNYAALYPGDFIDVGASSITINYAPLGASGFNYGFITDFLDLDWTDIPGELQDVTVATGAIGLLASNISMITPNSFQFQGTVDLVNGANFTLDLTAVHNQVPVPEPATVWMLLMGVGALGAAGARQRLLTRSQVAA